MKIKTLFLILITALFPLIFLSSCEALAKAVPSYNVTNNGDDWPKGETRTVPAKDVQPNISLPKKLGAGTIPLPKVNHQK